MQAQRSRGELGGLYSLFRTLDTLLVNLLSSLLNNKSCPFVTLFSKKGNRGLGLSLSEVKFPFERGAGWGVLVQGWDSWQDNWVIQTLLCILLFSEIVAPFLLLSFLHLSLSLAPSFFFLPSAFLLLTSLLLSCLAGFHFQFSLCLSWLLPPIWFGCTSSRHLVPPTHPCSCSTGYLSVTSAHLGGSGHLSAWKWSLVEAHQKAR